MSERETFSGNRVPPVHLANLTLASRRLWEGSEVQFGVRNLFNRRYWDPVGIEQGTDRLLEDGRCFFLRLSWSPTREKTPAHDLPGTSGALESGGP